MGERLLCKQEVVGSIPISSTSLRVLRTLRLARPRKSEDCPAKFAKQT